MVTVENGVVTGLKAGTAVITATYTDSNDNDYTDTCTVTVNGVINYGTHKSYNHEGVVAEIPLGTSIRCDGLTLADDMNTQFITLQKIPQVIGQRELRVFYITLIDAEDENNFITIAVRQYFGDNAEGILACVGVRASTFPTFMPGNPNGGYTDFYGAFNNTPTSPNSPMGISGGYGAGAIFSFTGNYLDNAEYQKYEIGFAIQGTAIYMHNNGAVTKVWDLNADTVAYAQANGGLSEENAWNGFTSDKVNISIRGDYFDVGCSEFALMLTSLGGSAVTDVTADNFYYHTWKEGGNGLM